MRFHLERQAARITYWIATDRARRALARCIGDQQGWSQTQLALATGMTQSAVARFETAGTVPTLPVLERLTAALDANLNVSFTPRGAAA